MSTRDPSEPGDAWEAFREYAALPRSSRSLKRLVRDGRSITTLKRMSLRWRWQARIDAYESPNLGAQVIPLRRCVPAEHERAGSLTTSGDAGEAVANDSPNEAGPAPGDERADVRADVCTGDLLEHVEQALRRELARSSVHTAPELMKIKSAVEDVMRQRREREVVEAHVEYDLSRLTDEEAETLRELCAKARVA